MSQPSPTKSERRVLVDKSTNASLTQSLSQSTTKSNISTSKALCDMPSIPSSVLTGQKRSIDQVDFDQNGSSSTKSSFNRIRREDEFYIYEESNTQSSTDTDKQMTLSSAFVQTAPIFDQNTQPKNSSSQRSDTMSSLLNLSFGTENKSLPNPLSAENPSAPSPPKPKAVTTTTSVVPTDPTERKAFIQQKADLLRSRVQFAMKNMKNVKDNQIDRRISELEAHANSRDRLSISHLLRTSPHPINATRIQLHQQQQHRQGKDEDMDLTPKAKIPKLLPAPILRPAGRSGPYPPKNTIHSSPPASAASSKMEGEVTPVDASVSNESIHKNKSNGNGNSSDNGDGDDNPPEISASPVQSHSPSQTRDPIIMIKKNEKMCAVEQMLAAEKDDAIDGLMKLMQTTTKYDALDEEWTG
ncbi:hypothetical protein PAAG_11423 [Paracoccidioides lutzii Pb01]|uniref:Uncharacterized protein n=1 Tax=Paracoccidioides lutzii (strain ATCC MYA-826 / Pb01) TaxID=502779 RepID=A0A0A2V675_PARBA|nr:hypothetical protein PAAG_11423 [Paracoccidioides lutzii Pb01]KGQ01847.1 hypothetical protein PAAG_11423 [Paracoccidioides lutzii Pb01]